MFPETDEDWYDDDDDVREVERQNSRWNAKDDEVEDLIDWADGNED